MKTALQPTGPELGNPRAEKIPTTMGAVLFHAIGAPSDVLMFKETALPTPQTGELLVRIEARPIQPVDLRFIGGGYRIKPQFPQIAGLEGAGVVVTAGMGTRLPAGARVAFRYPGTWAEYAIVPESRAYIVPDDIPIESAAQFALNPVTAWGLLDDLDVRAGQWIGINAPTSAVAQLVHGLARMKNIGIVGLQRPGSSTPLDFPSLPLDTPDLPTAVRAITGGSLLSGYLDSVGGEAITRVVPAIEPGSNIVSYGMLEREPAKISNVDMIYRNLTWKGFGIDRWLARRAESVKAMESELWDAIRAQALTLPVRQRYPLAQFHPAVMAAAASSQRGKVLFI